MVDVPPLGTPGEIVWVQVRAPKLRPSTATGESKFRPGMLVGQVADDRWMVVGLTTLSQYADGKPRTQIPPHLWRPLIDQCPRLGHKTSYLWGGDAVIVPASDLGFRIGFAGPELRALIMSSVSNVPMSLRSAVLRLTDEERAAAGVEAPASEWPLRPAVPPGQIHHPAPVDAREVDDHAVDDQAADDQPAAVEDHDHLEPANHHGSPDEEPAMDTPDHDTIPSFIDDETLAALAVLARNSRGNDDPFFRSTFGTDTVKTLITELIESRRRHEADLDVLADARTALVAARDEIRRLAKGEPNWGGPETAAIEAIDHALHAA